MGQRPHPSRPAQALTFRGFVHRVPELEARRVLSPQFLQLRPQQDVFLSLQGADRAQWSGGTATGTVFGDPRHPAHP